METIQSCHDQDYPVVEIIVYDDCSTDGTDRYNWSDIGVNYFRGEKNVGVGEAFNAGIQKATGDIIILMCADDLFTDTCVISDVVKIFKDNPKVGYVTRYYHQFVNGDRRPVRAWRDNDPIILANNPSGLAFLAKPLKKEYCFLSNRMFIESSHLAAEVLRRGWHYKIIPWDTVAVRVHDSTSTRPGYWLKRRVSSPVEDWMGLGAEGIARDYVSFIQIKNGFTTKALLEEIWNFIKIRPFNLLHPMFWIFGILAIFTPRKILRKIPKLYRKTWGRWTTKEIKRPR
jgi:glycosyltransferase involved in cell wall biosynthesis